MRVLIIGGTGFLGLPIAHRLLGSGHEVTIFHRGTGAIGLPKGVALFSGIETSSIGRLMIFGVFVQTW